MEPTELGFEGQKVVLKHGTGNPEASKYFRLWELEEYRRVSPGEKLVDAFLELARPRARSTCIDFGCGSGRAAFQLALRGRMDMTMIDFARNCLDDDIKKMLPAQSDVLRFQQADLEKPINIRSEYGFCADVLEHIPPDKVELVMSNILRASQHIFFSIATFGDVCGTLIGEELHLTVKKYAWWLEQFRKFRCQIHWSRELNHTALFYVSAWADGLAVVDAGVINIEPEKLIENVQHNVGQGWSQLIPKEEQDVEIMILGGGPSLNDFKKDIIQMREEGVKPITLNGSYNWALERGLKPSATIIVDGREFNARFAKPVIDDCKYLISSQCDPSVFEGLPKDRTIIWHTANDDIAEILKENYEGIYYPIIGGSTVLTRAIPLLRCLGFKRFHLFGCDSCIEGNVHHAYPQPENDDEYIMTVQVSGGGRFACFPWMMSQAQEIIELIKFMGNEIELNIHGDGLLKNLLETGAQFADDDAYLIEKED